MIKSALKYGIGLALMAVAFYFAFHGQNLSDAVEAIRNANPGYLIAGFLVMLLSHALRAWRWQILLRPVKQRTSFGRSFRSVIAGYGMNNLLPRSGEIVRPYMMSKGEEISMSSALATIIVERLSDVLALAILVGLAFAGFSQRLSETFPFLAGRAIPSLIIGLLLLTAFIVLLFNEDRTARFIRFLTRPLPPKLSAKIESAGRSFSVGLNGIDKRSLLPVLIGTAGIWGLYALSMYISLHAFSDPGISSIGVAGTLLLLTLSGVSFTIPTPGASGTYHFFISKALIMIFAVSTQVALGYAIVTHAISFVLVTIMGAGFLMWDGISIKQVGAPSQETTPIPGAEMRAANG